MLGTRASIRRTVPVEAVHMQLQDSNQKYKRQVRELSHLFRDLLHKDHYTPYQVLHQQRRGSAGFQDTFDKRLLVFT